MDSHLEKVGYNSHLIAQSLQLVPRYENLITDEFVDTISTASVLHDIGEIFLSDGVIIHKEEGGISREDIRLHTEEGARILEEINSGTYKSPALEMAILIARYHHANWDGSGYPEGVSGTDIPLEARITTVANDFDAWLGRIHGGEGHTVEESISMINDGSGTKYDPHIVEVFNKIYKQLRIV